MIDQCQVESLNQSLIDLYGIDTSTGEAIWRVVWSEDQFEKRLGTYSDYTREGIYLKTVTEVRLVPKYRQWIKEKWVLEQLTVVPEMNMPELPTTKLSYEPMFPFEDARGEALPPKLEVCKIVIDSIYAAMGKKSLAKYVDEEAINDPKRLKAVNKIYEELFGNESEITDSLAFGTAVIKGEPKNG